jgi:hypothetical protein
MRVRVGVRTHADAPAVCGPLTASGMPRR